MTTNPDRPRAVFLCHRDGHLHGFRLPLMRPLVSRGWDVIALCPPGNFSHLFKDDGIRHVPFHVDRASLNPFKEAAVVVSLRRILKDLRPDLIHSFTMKPNIYGALAAAWAGVGKRVASVNGLGSFYTEPGRTLPSRIFRRGLDVLYGTAMRRVDRVLFENCDDRDDLVKLGVCRREQCVVIQGAGVDVDLFTPADKRADGPLVVTMVARLIRHKGVDEYLAAAETLKRRWGDAVVFQLAGTPDPGNPWPPDMARLDECVRQGVVRRLGYISDIPALMRGTDIFTLPSYYREGTPVSVLEAMSAGLAVVTTDGVGCRETVIPEKSGLIVPTRDTPALVSALDRLLADPELRRRFGREARKRAQDVFAVEKVVAATFDVYRALLPGLL
jgi:N,N'-diacetylbacillosaminyl-diphospho-undecaprenol alpha-1,3-N-acetylgalactosaminyltransferase